jgi:hypothetical protein
LIICGLEPKTRLIKDESGHKRRRKEKKTEEGRGFEVSG